tara:strand:+ start:349 stop:5430 length:5082 start_codon:yes stop_codon:yes gene_type:complete
MANALMNNEITNQQTKPEPKEIDVDNLPETVNTAGMSDVVSAIDPRKSKLLKVPSDVVEGAGIVGKKGMGEDEPYELTEEGKLLTTGEMAEQSIQEQQRPLSIDEFKAQVKSGQIKSVGQINREAMLGNIRALENANAPPTSKQLATRLIDNAYIQYVDQQDKPRQFVTFGKEASPGKFEFAPTEQAVSAGEDSKLYSVQENIFRGKAAIASVVRDRFQNTGLDLDDQKRVENVFIRGLSNGKFWDTTIEKFNDGALRGAFDFLPGTIINYGLQATSAAIQTAGSGIAAALTDRKFRGFIEQWKDTAEVRAQAKNWWSQNIAEGTLGIKQLSGVMNDMVRESLDQQLKDGDITQEDYDRIVTQTVQAPDGSTEKLQRVFINEELAQSLLNDSLKNLTDSEQYASVLLESVAGAMGVGKVKLASGRATQKKMLPIVQKIIDRGKKANASESDKALAARLLGKNELQQARILQAEKLIGKVNEKSLVYAMGMDRVDANFTRLAAQRDDISQRLKAMRMQGIDVNSSEYRNLELEWNSLTNTTVNKYLTGRVLPQLKENFVEAVPVSLIMYASGEYMTDTFGGDRLAAEGIGGLFALTVGKFSTTLLGKGAYWANQQAGDIFNKGLNFFDSLADASVAGITGGRVRLKGFFADQDIDAYAKWYKGATGNELDAKSRRSLKYLGEVSKSMTDEARDQVVDSMTDFNERTNRILSLFDDTIKVNADGIEYSERSLMAQDLRETFAHQSGMVWMQSALQLSSFTLDARDAKSLEKVSELTGTALAQIKGLDANKKMIQKLEERAKMERGPFGGTQPSDPSNMQELLDFTDALKTSLVKQEEMVADNRERVIQQIQEYRKAVLADPTAEMPANVTEVLNSHQVDLELSLTRGTDASGEGLIDAAKRHAELAAESRRLLTERATALKDYRNDSALHQRMTARTVEAMMHNHLSASRKRAKRGFKKVDAMAGEMGATIDISEMVTTLKGYSPDAGMEFARFFAKDSQFFLGTLGKKAYTAMNRIAVNSLKSMEGVSYDHLVTMATNPKSEHFLGENPKPLDIAMYWQSKEGTTFKGLVATPGEVMDVYAAFRDYAVRINDDGLANTYKEFADSVSDVVRKQAPELHAEWKKAQTIYKTEWFDRVRVGGPFAAVHKSQTGDIKETAKVEKGEGKFLEEFGIGETIPEGTLASSMHSVAYKGTTPYDSFDPFVDQIDKALSSADPEKAVKKIVSIMDEITQEFSDEVSGSVFNINTDTGSEKLALMQSVLTELVYAKWGVRTLEKLGDTTVAQDVKTAQTGGYNFGNIDRINSLQEALTVAVRGSDPDNPSLIKRVPLIDLTEMAEEQRGIHRLIQDENFNMQKLDDYQQTIASQLDRLISRAGRGQAIQGDLGVAEIFNVIKRTTPGAFLEDYVLRGTPDKMDRLRETLLLKLGPTFTVKVEGQPDVVLNTAETIDKGMKNLILDGLLELGGTAPVAGRMSTGMNGEKYANEVMYNPEKLVKLFDGSNPDATAVLDKFMDADHQEYLRDIAILMSQSASPSGGFSGDDAALVGKIGNIMRPMGPNQLVSRAFNLARGMVSPTYVAAEIGISLASQAGLDMVKMAAGNKEGADLMLRLMKNPKSMTKADLDTFDNMVKGFIVTELGRMGPRGAELLESYFVDIDARLADLEDVDAEGNPRVNPAAFPKTAAKLNPVDNYYSQTP